MAKKSISELKKGLIHNCEHCGAKCNDKIQLHVITGNDKQVCYMGQINVDRQKIVYLCSRDCHNYVYRKTMVDMLKNLKRSSEKAHRAMKSNFQQGLRKSKLSDKEMTESLLLLKSTKAILEFYDAIIEGKSLYELHSLRLFAMNLNKKLFEFEDGTQDEEIIQKILFKRKIMEEMDITVFPKKKY
jgi:hypothetical protein